MIPAVTLGISATTNSIGRERERELTQHASARLLFFFGPEVAFSLRNHENLELVLRVQHRSSAGRTLGGVQEGYDADTAALRFRY